MTAYDKMCLQLMLYHLLQH